MRVLVIFFAIIATASTLRCYEGTQKPKLEERLNNLYPQRVSSDSDFCFIQRVSITGFFITYEEFHHRDARKNDPCSKEEFKTQTSDCFNPDNNTMCCRGDYCNYMEGLNCSDVYVPKKCPQGLKFVYNYEKPENVTVIENIKLESCPLPSQFCSFEFLEEEDLISNDHSVYKKHYYGCSNDRFGKFCDKPGCWKIKEIITSDVNRCCRPIDEGKELSMNWGEEMMKEKEEKSTVKPNHEEGGSFKSSDPSTETQPIEETSSDEPLNEDSSNDGNHSTEKLSIEETSGEEPSAEEPLIDPDDLHDLRNHYQPNHIHIAFLLVLMVIF